VEGDGTLLEAFFEILIIFLVIHQNQKFFENVATKTVKYSDL